MKISLNFIVRIAGMLILAYLGLAIGTALSDRRPDETQLFATQLLMLAGAGLGLLITPRVTIDLIREVLRQLQVVPLNEILLIGLGGLIGLIFAALLAVPLALLPRPLSYYLPLLMALACAYLGAMIFSSRRRELHDLAKSWRRPITALTSESESDEAAAPPALRRFLVDTSAVIDGRIAAVAETGFLEGVLLVPSFVLAELQGLADSGDELRRNKGRRGLELLNLMQKKSPLPVEVINVEVKGANRVDDKLVVLARQYNCPVITNDFNLNRVAGLQGVTVLSLNQLSEAVRPPVVPDQRLFVLIRNEGNSRQQGVGYLDDGTPVIVEDARSLIGQTVEVVVTRLHQTQTGRLIFAHLSTSVEQPLPVGRPVD